MVRWVIRWRDATHKTPTAAMFEAFLTLWDGTDEAIRQFVERWGPLSMPPDPLIDEIQEPDLGTVKEGEDVGFDSLKAWRFFSKRAYCVLKLASELRRGKPGSASDWDVVAGPEMIQGKSARPWLNKDAPSGFPFGMPAHARRQINFTERDAVWGERLGEAELKSLIADEVGSWLEKSKLGLNCQWRKDSWQMEFSYRGWILSAIALQLASRVAQADGLYVCSGSDCGRLYLRNARRPNANENNYCERCVSKKVPVQDAEKRRIEKRANARQLFESGKSLAEITRLLSVRKVATVRRWVGKGEQHGKAKAR